MFKLCHVRLYDYFGLGTGQLLLVKRKKKTVIDKLDFMG